MEVLLRGGRLIGQEDGDHIDEVADVRVVNGLIVERGASLASAGSVIDCAGRVVCPGFVDLAARLCEPGYEYKEDLHTGAKAAARGGFTTVCVLPNTKPVNDCRTVSEHILRRASEVSQVRIVPIGALTVALAGEHLCEYGDFAEAGLTLLSDGDRCIQDADVMRRALEYATTFSLLVVQRSYDRKLAAGAVMHEGEVATRLGLAGEPAAAESVVLARDLELVACTGARFHAARLSSRRSVELVRDAKKRGLPVTASVAAINLKFSHIECADFDPGFRVVPPLRTDDDRQALIEGLGEGVLDCVVSDHSPQSLVEKQLEFDRAEAGSLGLETAAGVVFDLVDAKQLTLERAVDCLSEAPARVVNPNHRGGLAIGSVADLVVLDLGRRAVIDVAAFASKSKNSAFQGQTMSTPVVRTLVHGRTVYDSAGML